MKKIKKTERRFFKENWRKFVEENWKNIFNRIESSFEITNISEEYLKKLLESKFYKGKLRNICKNYWLWVRIFLKRGYRGRAVDLKY